MSKYVLRMCVEMLLMYRLIDQCGICRGETASEDLIAPMIELLEFCGYRITIVRSYRRFEACPIL